MLAYEGFDYQVPELFRTDNANGGFGWNGPWTANLTRPVSEGNANPFVLNPRESLVRANALEPSVGGSFDYRGFAKYQRRLATPIRLDTDAVYYLSFLFCRHAPSSDPVNTVAVLLRTTEEMERSDSRKRLNIGVKGTNQLFMQLGSTGTRAPLPLNYGEPYLLVAKIAASASHGDQVFLRVYGPQETVDHVEPSSWSVVGRRFQSDQVFDWLEVHLNSKTRQAIDEIRIGTTWPSVTAPWRAK